MTLPDGWTDDFNLQLKAGRTIDELVDRVIQAKLRADDADRIIEKLVEEFVFTQGDAGLAMERTFGGVVRAATGRPSNCPDKSKDPIAWTSYQRCLTYPELIVQIYPEWKDRVRKKSWWQRLLSK